MQSRSLSRAEVRAVDEIAIRDYGLAGIVLMENAGRGAAESLLRQGVRGPVVICAGKGNNGGDGFVIARHLDAHGIATTILLTCAPAELSGDAAINCRVALAAELPIVVCRSAADWTGAGPRLAEAEWIVDALLGTGTRGELREPYVAAIAAINQAGRPVLAVDLPSGLDCDTGAVLGSCVQARHTVTFVARKTGFDQPGAERWTGSVQVVDIGIPRKLLHTLGIG